MVDITFPFMILFGGALTGLITGLVTGQTKSGVWIDVLVCSLFGYAAAGLAIATPLLRTVAETYPAHARLTSDLLYFSPLMGGLVGAAVLRIVRAFRGQERPEFSWVKAAGQVLMIIGGVMTAVSALLVAGVVVLYYVIPGHGLTSLPLQGVWRDFVPWLPMFAFGYLIVWLAPAKRA